MFKPTVLKIASYAALVCCLLSLIGSVYIVSTFAEPFQYLAILSWLLLLYASYLGIRLSAYDIYDEDRQRLGLYIYGIIALFLLFSFTNFSLGILPAAFVAFQLHRQKKGIDDWMARQKNVDTQNE